MNEFVKYNMQGHISTIEQKSLHKSINYLLENKYRKFRVFNDRAWKKGSVSTALYSQTLQEKQIQKQQ